MNFESFRQVLTTLSDDRGFAAEAAQIRAKALLGEVTTEEVIVRWTYVVPRVIRNLVAASVAAEALSTSSSGNDGLRHFQEQTRSLASVWEALAQLEEGTSRDTALLNAAVQYELAGYQANAACLARRVQTETSRVPTLLELVTLFLRRQLVKLRRRAAIAIAPRPEVTEIDELADALATGLTARGFKTLSEALLAGRTDLYAPALEDLARGQRIFAELGQAQHANLVRSILSLVPVIRCRSTWTVLLDGAGSGPRFDRYLKLLSRGVGDNILESRSVCELWPSQVAALKADVLDASANHVVRMPTSAGKTRIAELAIVHALASRPHAKCIYVAPYRALVAELRRSFLVLLRDLGYSVSALMGSYESDDFEERLVTDSDLLIVTPEKLDLILRADPEQLNAVELVVLDEVQLVGDRSRGTKFELLLGRLKRRHPHIRFLAISLLLPDVTLKEIARFLSSPGEPGNVIREDWRPSRQRYALFEWTAQRGVLRYAADAETATGPEFVPGVISERRFEFRNPRTRRLNRRVFPDRTSKAQVAAELALRFADLGPVLIFCSQRSFVEPVAGALFERLQLAERVGEDTPGHFTPHEDRRSTTLAGEWLGSVSLVQWLRRGIGIHHGNLAEPLRAAIEGDFRDRQLRVLIATSTLAQGVNLPMRTVIVHSCWRHLDDEHQRILARDYWNIAGRAGRAGEETEGLVIHIALQERERDDFRHFLSRREDVEPVRSALVDRLYELMDGRLSPEALKAGLDSEVLALAVEEQAGETIDAIEIARTALTDTLFAQQTRELRSDADRVHQILAGAVEEARQAAPDLGLRAVYSATGLSVGSCRRIKDYAEREAETLSNLIRAAQPGDVRSLIEMLAAFCLRLPEVATDRDVGGNHLDLLEQWIGGADIDALAASLPSGTSREDLGRFLEDAFGYRLSWGVSAFLRIAGRILGIERSQMSAVARALPTMIKFGLPQPESCWAMSAGVPFRRAALRLAQTFRRESEVSNAEAFRNWLSELTAERLVNEFSIHPSLIDDVGRSIFLASANPLIKLFQGLDRFLPREVLVAGVRYGDRRRIASTIRPGDPLFLVRDYDNLVDRNAVQVEAREGAIGFLPRQIAEILAPELDVGAALETHVVHRSKARVPEVRISIGLPSRALGARLTS